MTANTLEAIKPFLDRIGYREDKKGATASVYSEDVAALVESVDKSTAAALQDLIKLLEFERAEYRLMLREKDALFASAKREIDRLLHENSTLKRMSIPAREPSMTTTEMMKLMDAAKAQISDYYYDSPLLQSVLKGKHP